MVINLFPSVCFAAEKIQIVSDKPIIAQNISPGNATVQQVLTTKTYSASKCKKIYNEMSGYSGWEPGLAGTLVGLLGIGGTITGGITGAAALIQEMNYKSAKKAFYNGWKSGKGCKMVIYDNAVPWVYAL